MYVIGVLRFRTRNPLSNLSAVTHLDSQLSPVRSHRWPVSRWWYRERTRSCKLHRSAPPPTLPPGLRSASLGVTEPCGLKSRSGSCSWSESVGRRPAVQSWCRLSSRCITVRGLQAWAHSILTLVIRTSSGLLDTAGTSLHVCWNTRTEEGWWSGRTSDRWPLTSTWTWWGRKVVTFRQKKKSDKNRKHTLDMIFTMYLPFTHLDLDWTWTWTGPGPGLDLDLDQDLDLDHPQLFDCLCAQQSVWLGFFKFKLTLKDFLYSISVLNIFQ